MLGWSTDMDRINVAIDSHLHRRTYVARGERKHHRLRTSRSHDDKNPTLGICGGRREGDASGDRQVSQEDA